MGWTAVTGHLDPGALLLGALLYAWQFPHFNALSWNIREDYSRAGYQMLVLKDPKKNARVALRYSLSLFLICAGLAAADVTSPCFLATSSLPNAVLTYYAWKFDRNTGTGTARKLFFASLFHLPALVLLLLVHKKWPRTEERKQEMESLVHVPFGVHASDVAK
jgi:protoheme IX farnesyltransferase